MFSFEFCEISKKNFFTEHIWTTAYKCYYGQILIFWYRTVKQHSYFLYLLLFYKMQISIFTDILLSLCNNNERRQNKNKTYRIHEYTLKNTENRKYNISTCIFIIVKEIFFTISKSNPKHERSLVCNLIYCLRRWQYVSSKKEIRNRWQTKR